MNARNYTILMACAMLVAACGDGGHNASQDSAGSNPTPDAPVPVATTPVLLGSETVYFIDSGGAYHYSTLHQEKPESDGYTTFSSSRADEDGPQPALVDYKLTSKGWILGETANGIRLEDNGATLAFRDGSDGHLSWARYKEIDVAGKPVTSYLSNYFTFQKEGLVQLTNAVFPPGSRLAYVANGEPRNDQYDLSNSPSPYQFSSGVFPSSIADLLERATTSDPVCVGIDKRTALTFTGSASQGSGTVTAYETDGKTSVPCAVAGPVRATGSWSLRSVNGANILVLILPGLDDEDLEPAFGGYSITGAHALTTFNEIDGKVVQGYFLPAVPTLPPESEMPDGYLLNPTAWNYVKARLPIK